MLLLNRGGICDHEVFQFYRSTIINWHETCSYSRYSHFNSTLVRLSRGEVHATHSEYDISILYKYDYNVNTRHHAGCG